MRAGSIVWIIVCGCATAAPPAAPVRQDLGDDDLREKARERARQTPRVMADGLEGLIRCMPRFAEIAAPVYAERGFAPLASRGETLTADAATAIELLFDVESHGLDGKDYPLEALRAAQSRWNEARVAYHALLLPPPAPADLTAQERAHWARTWLDARRAAASTLKRSLVDLEPLLVAGFLQYALDFRHQTRAHPDRAQTALEQTRLVPLFADALRADLSAAAGRMGEAMRRMWPAHPRYNRTRAALEHYRGLVGKVPRWQPERLLKEGRSGPPVVRLKARMKAQGYYEGPMDEVFGPPLTAAVKRFQAHHHLEADGVVAKRGDTPRALMVPMSQRVDQLILSLQRHRESDVRMGAAWIRVNVARFQLRLWEAGRAVLHRRVVVGKKGSKLDAGTGLAIGLNRTPLLNSTIDEVVLNPGWFVPPRIVEKELSPRAGGSNEWYAKRGYRVRSGQGAKVRLWQAPGPRNALGRVKLGFKNAHAVYIHDTPAKASFQSTARAKSHGCVRLQDPLTVARILMERDGVSPLEFEALSGSGKTHKHRLSAKVPVYIEYNTVGFEPGDAEPYFAADVYGYDAAFWAGNLPYSRRARYLARKRDNALMEQSPTVAAQHSLTCR